jgi:hypothetical protein
MSNEDAEYRGDAAKLKSALINVIRAQVAIRDALITISNEARSYDSMVALMARIDEIGKAIDAALDELDHA